MDLNDLIALLQRWMTGGSSEAIHTTARQVIDTGIVTPQMSRTEVAVAFGHWASLNANNLALANQGIIVQISLVDTARKRTILVQAAHHAESARILAQRLEGVVGRDAEQVAVRTLIDAMRPTGGYILMTAPAGEGKSCLIAMLIDAAGSATTPHHFIPLTPGPDYQYNLLRTLVAQLILYHDLDPDLFLDISYPALRDAFHAVLHQLAGRGIEETIYLDGLDQLVPTSTGLRDLSFLPPHLPSGIIIVLGSRPNETLYPLEPHYCVDYPLPSLTVANFRTIIANQSISIPDATLRAMYDALGGNALFLGLAAREMPRMAQHDWATIIDELSSNPLNLFSMTLRNIKTASPTLWKPVIKPILAILLVAQEALTSVMLESILGVDHEDVQEGLDRLGGLLRRSEERYALYHLKLYDYLREPATTFRISPDQEQLWHGRLATWCLPTPDAGATIWTDSGHGAEDARRAYARHHAITHLVGAARWETLWQIINDGIYGRHKCLADPSTEDYTRDLDRARDAAVQTRDLPNLWRSSLLRLSLTNRIDHWPDALFVGFARHGQSDTATKAIELVTDVTRRIRLLAALLPVVDGERSVSLVTRAMVLMETIDAKDKEKHSHVVKELVEGLVRLGQLAEAQALATTIADAEQRVEALRVVIKALVESGQLAEAEALATTIADATQRLKALVAVVERLVDAGRLDEAQAVVTTIADVEQRGIALVAVVKGLVEAGQLTAAQVLATTITDAAQQTEAVVIVAKGLVSAGQPTAAQTLATSIKDVAQRGKVLVTVAERLVDAGRLDEAQAVVTTIADVEQRGIALVAVVKGLVEAGQLTAAQAPTTIPDGWERAKVLVAVVEGLVGTGRLNEAQALATTIPDGWRRVRVLREVVKGLVGAGQITEAQALATTIKDVQQQAEAMGVVVKGLVGAGQITEAQALETTINEWSPALGLAAVVEGLVDVGRLTEAQALAPTIPNPWERAGAVIALVKGLVSAEQIVDVQAVAKMFVGWRQAKGLVVVVGGLVEIGLLTEAQALAMSIKDAAQRGKVLVTVAERLVDAGRLNEAQVVATTIADVEQRGIALVAVVKELVSRGRLDEAQAFVKTIPDARQRAEVLREVVEGLVEAGRLAKAQVLATTIADGWDQAEVLREVVKGLVGAGQITEAQALATTIADGWDRAEAMVVVVKGLVGTGRLNEAQVLAMTIPDVWQQAEAMGVVVKGLVEAGQITEAQALATTIKDVRQQAEAMGVVVKGLVEAGQITEAQALATTIKDAWLRAEGLGRVMASFIGLGRLDEAQAVATTIANVEQREIALVAVVKELVSRGQLIEAQAVATTIANVEQREVALAVVAKGLVSTGQLDEAQALVTTIANVEQREMVLAAVVKGLMSAGRLDEAQALATMSGGWQRVEAMGVVVEGLLKTQHFAEAEFLVMHQLSGHIQESVLTMLIQHLPNAAARLALVSRLWRRATTRKQLLTWVSCIYPLFCDDRGLALVIRDALAWVDTQIYAVSVLDEAPKDYHPNK